MVRELLVVPKESHARRISEKMGMILFPDHDGLPFSENSPFVRHMRLKVLLSTVMGEDLKVVSTLMALSRYTISRSSLISAVHRIVKGKTFDLRPEDFLRMGYTRVDIVRDYGEFAFRGDIIDFFPPSSDVPVRVELFDDVVEDMRFFDPITQRSLFSSETAVLAPAREYIGTDHGLDTVVASSGDFQVSVDYFEGFKVMVWDPERVFEETRRKIEELIDLAGNRAEDYSRLSFEDIGRTFKKLGDYEIVHLDLKSHEIESVKRAEREVPVYDIHEIEPGDVVVHKDYGIGRFEGIVALETSLGKRDYLRIRYEDSVLYVPVDRISRVHKYIGSENVKLDSLSSKRWRSRLTKIRGEIEKKVKELVRLYAKRSSVKGLALHGDPQLEAEFAESFPFIETNDQLKAIEEVLRDLESDRPMDRLVCGDSGYGKTEVAMRAAFRAVVSGKQVALIAPTVVLANQHYRNFKERMERFGVVVELLDGTRTKKEKERILEGLRKGTIDVIVGTHALLSDRVDFSDLGLVVIDEEHKFGVVQKEKLKKLRISVNVLSMSATPIPRTLQMALSGMRDISVINTPPIGRKPVVVHILEYSDEVVRGAVLRELARGGQVLYVHNRVEELEEVEERIKRIIPGVNMMVAHGRMNKRKLERAVEAFYSGDVDLLLCTTVVESGLDIPTANTIIVDDSHRYGLAQLYQLRGRVGRRNVKGYAYFLYPKGTKEDVLKRLRILKSYTGPGSGMKIALRDLEIRGYGDLLGIDQHGYIESIGYKYYVEILKESLGRITGEFSETEYDVEIEGFPGNISIPEDYVSDPMERMRLYRRLSSAGSLKDIREVEEYMRDVFGSLPESVRNLIRLAELRVKLGKLGIRKLKIMDGSILLEYEGVKPDIFEDRSVLNNESRKIMVVYNTSLEDLERELDGKIDDG